MEPATGTIFSGNNSTALILPVKLLSFNGSGFNGVSTLLWISAVEVNPMGYELEKSVDGTNFTKVAYAAAAAANTSILQVENDR